MKKILDACCGSRMFWFDRENQDVLFADNRELETTLCDGRALLVKPDIKMDFREMPFLDNTFKIVVFDPPHLKQAGSESWLAKKYGVLPKDWKPYLKAGFDECMRVLEPDGILDYSKEIHELNGREYKCWCCGRDMKSHVPGIEIMPYTATYRITKGKDKGLFVFRPLCRSCAYRYGRGVVECDGNTYMEPDEFSEKKWKEEQ